MADGHDIQHRIVGAPATGLVDPFGRRIAYLRLSVTDRCDLRCTYCMAARPTFLPRQSLLSLNELYDIACAFMDLGTRHIRLTGGEPLVRKGVMGLVERLGAAVASGRLDELTLTTNGTLLADHARDLARHGVRRINVSLDTLDPIAFSRITRGGRLDQVMRGLDAAQAEGIAIKINTVALRADNAADLPDMIAWAHARGFGITLIETMPLGDTGEDRTDQFLSLTDVRRDLERRWTLTPLMRRTGGPARYARVEQTGGVVGFITPMSHGFCDSCNRVRVSCTGDLFLCLGQEDKAELGPIARAHPGRTDRLVQAIREAVARKPKSHDFRIGPGRAPSVGRTMSVTGG